MLRACLVLVVACGGAPAVVDRPTVPTNEQAGTWTTTASGAPIPDDAVFDHDGGDKRAVYKLRRPHDEVHRAFVAYLPTKGFQIERDLQQGGDFVLDIASGDRRFTVSIVKEDANTTQLEIIAP